MKLKITYKTSSTKDGLYAYGLHVEATPVDPSNDSDDPNIFVFRRSTPIMNPFGSTDKAVDDNFFNVATPVDMYDIPIGKPDIENGMPYYRDSSLDLWFRNLEDVENAKLDIDNDIASLCRLYDNLDDVSHYQHEESVIHDGSN